MDIFRRFRRILDPDNRNLLSLRLDEDGIQRYSEGYNYLKNFIQKRGIKSARRDPEFNSILEDLSNLPNLPNSIYLHNEIPPQGQILYEHNPGFSSGIPYMDYFNDDNVVIYSDYVESGFIGYIGQAAELEWILKKYLWDRNSTRYTPLSNTALILRSEIYYQTGQYPLRNDMYPVDIGGLYLSPTSEVQMLARLRDRNFDLGILPHRFFTLSTAFRKESGRGFDRRGILRVRQFEKFELGAITTTDSAFMELEYMCTHVEEILTDLNLRFRKILLNPRDMAIQSDVTYDYEIYLPLSQIWSEVSSVSSCSTYQTELLEVSVHRHGKREFLVSLNGTAFGLNRLFAGIIETHGPEWIYNNLKG